jgi:hypothetical protein
MPTEAPPMSDSDRTIGEAFRLIEDTRTNCANRAARHVDKDVWNERNRQIDVALDSLGQRMVDQETKLAAERTARENEAAEFRNRQDTFRRAMYTTIVGVVLTVILTTMALQAGIGVGG